MNAPVPPCPFRLPLIAILRGIRPEEALANVQALVEEGFDAIEIPLNSPQWASSIGAGIGGELYKPGQPVERTREHARAFRQAYLEHTP